MNKIPNNIVWHLVVKTLMVGLAVLSCFGASFYMAIHAMEGWGWFLFIGLICCSRFPTWVDREDEEEEEDEEAKK